MKRLICDFEARIIRRTIKCDQRRCGYRTIAFKTKKRMKIRRMTRVKSFICEGENSVFNSLSILSQRRDLRLGEM
jgi:hypothetical protein